MAETTDRPQVPGQVPPDVASGEELSTTAPVATETYQPLSLLALAGFGLAVVYAVVVLIGGVVALFSRIPWLMPNWTFLLPLAALVVCWMAQTRIRDSEGTLSGRAFTTWGFRLTILVGLTYAAYYAFTFFALRLQAVECADRFFEQLKQGNLEQVFLMSQGISTKGMDSSELRDMIESRFNQPIGRSGSPGPFTRLRQERFVRFIEMDGAQAKITPMGVADWEYSQGGYRMVLKYHIATSCVEFDMNVETFRRDSKPGESKGPQWQVRLTQGETAAVQASWNMTPRGREIEQKSKTGYEFADAWTQKVNQQQWGEAYLDTLKPGERSRLRKGEVAARLLSLAPVAGVAPLGLCDAACRDFLDGWQKLESGQLIRIDDKTFWAGKRQREDIKKRVHKTFQPGKDGKPTVNLGLQPSMPLTRESDGRTTLFFDVSLRYMDESTGRMQYQVEGQLAVTAEGSDADSSPSAWRVEFLNIERGRTPPPMPGEQPPPPNAAGGAQFRPISR